MAGNARQVINMANSIVGVSILSMPFCFKETGILLGITLVLVSGFITKKTCMFLIRSAIMARRRSYEFLAFHVFGVSGKLFVELCMILFLIGICVSFHVVVGDLAPAIVARFMNIDNSPSLRCTLLIGIAILVILPLCLLRNLDNLASMSACSIMFYFFLITVIFWHAFPKLWEGTWVHVAELWKLSGALQVLPICSLGLACQSNIFEIYDSVPDPDVPKMRFVVNHAVNLCSAIYIAVGFLGYVAFIDMDFGGNIIMSFPSSELTEGIKLFFIVSLAISFPLMIFPCRTSIHSLLYRRSNPSSHDLVGNYMPESRFKGITFGILVFSLIIGILIPNIEFVLGLLGSTMGMLIALILPSILFIKVNSKASTERLLAQAIMLMGLVLIVTGTYLNLAHINEVQSESRLPPTPPETLLAKVEPQLPKIEEKIDTVEKPVEVLPIGVDSATRKEPVAPEPPPEEDNKSEKEKENEEGKGKTNIETKLLEKENEMKKEEFIISEKQKKAESNDRNTLAGENKEHKKEGDTLHPDAIQKEEKENEEEKDKNKGSIDIEKKQAEILEKIEEQHQEQQQILEVQKKILKELEDAKMKQQEDAKKQEEAKANAIGAGNVPLALLGQNPMVPEPVAPAAALSPNEGNLAAVQSNALEIKNAPLVGRQADTKLESGHYIPQGGSPVLGGSNDLANKYQVIAKEVDINQQSQGISVNQLDMQLIPMEQSGVGDKFIPLYAGIKANVNPQIPPYKYIIPSQAGNQPIPAVIVPLDSNGDNAVAGALHSNMNALSLGNNPVGQNQPLAENQQNRQEPPKSPAMLESVPSPDPIVVYEGYPVLVQRNYIGGGQKPAESVQSEQMKSELDMASQQQKYLNPKNSQPGIIDVDENKKKLLSYPKDAPAKMDMSSVSPVIKQRAIKFDDEPVKKDQEDSIKEADVQAAEEKILKLPSNKNIKEEDLLQQSIRNVGEVKAKEKILDKELISDDPKIKRKSRHDEERRKRQVEEFLFDLPKVDLLRDLKWKDAGDFAYDTRHLLWTGRSRRRKRNKGRDEDYYWDET